MRYTVTVIPPNFSDDVVEIKADSEEQVIETFYCDNDSECVIVSTERYDAEQTARERDNSEASFIRTWGIGVIYPYRANGLWIFDDDATGLKEAPFFAAGAVEMIDLLVRGYKPAEQSVAVYLCAKPFKGYCMRLDLLREENGGHWYQIAKTESTGWLCPAIMRRFKNVPSFLFCSAKLVRAAVDRERDGNYVINYIPPPFETDVVEISARSKEEVIEKFYEMYDGQCVIVSTEKKTIKKRKGVSKTKRPASI